MLKPPSDKISAETRARLLALADFIEADERHALRMESFYNPDVWTDGLPEPPPSEFCGTSACFAGYLAIIRGDANAIYQGDLGLFFRRGLSDLGITFAQAMHLFHGYERAGVRVTKAHGVRVLRNFAYTGEVDWSV